MAKCRLCGAEIKWVRTLGGKNMPCDPEKVYYRTDSASPERIVTPNGEVLQCVTLESGEDYTWEDDGWGYIPHFATCRGGIG